jgi:hypothetical protein
MIKFYLNYKFCHCLRYYLAQKTSLCSCAERILVHTKNNRFYCRKKLINKHNLIYLFIVKLKLDFLIPILILNRKSIGTKKYETGGLKRETIFINMIKYEDEKYKLLYFTFLLNKILLVLLQSLFLWIIVFFEKNILVIVLVLL